MIQVEHRENFISFRPAERHILRKRKRYSPSQWAEKERYLHKGARPGMWKNSRNPAMAGLMDLLGFIWLRVLVIVKGVQTGATEGVFCYLGCEADYSNGSDSALVVLADEKSVSKHSVNRLIPMVNYSRSLQQLKTSNPNDITTYKIRLKTGFSIEIGWATSEVSLASEAYRIVIMDEYDKYKSMLNAKEAEARTNTYEDRGKKVAKLSNPGEEGGPIDEAMQQCDVIIDYQPVCPDCKKRHVMHWENFRWPGQVTLDGEIIANPKTIRREKTAWYECPECGSRWDDLKRIKALNLASKIKVGDWCPSGWVPRTEIKRPYAVAAWFPSWISGLIESQSIIVAEWLEAQDNPDLLRAWYNKRAGLAFSTIQKDEMTEAEVLHGRRYTWRPEGATWIIPQRASLLVGSVDVQDNRLEVKTIAYGRGRERWILDRHYIHGSPSAESTLRQLDEYISRTWEHESGARLKWAAAGVDTGGHFTQVMYRWLRNKLGQRIYGVKGASEYNAPLTRWSLPNKKQRRQIPLLILNTTILKNDIHADYKTTEPGPGYIHIPETLDYAYCEGLCSEKPVDQRDKRGNKVRYWVKKKANIRNEPLDLLVYCDGVLQYINPDWDKLEAELRQQAAARTTGQQVVEKPQQRKRKIYSKGVDQ